MPSVITDYREYNTDTKVNFVVTLEAAALEKARAEGLHRVFKLQTTMATTSMVLFDSNGCIRFYDTPEQILEEYYNVRLNGYVKRKAYLIGLLEAEAKRLSNQVSWDLSAVLRGKIDITFEQCSVSGNTTVNDPPVRCVLPCRLGSLSRNATTNSASRIARRKTSLLCS